MSFHSSGFCITPFLAFMGGCFGFCAKSMDDPSSNALGMNGQSLRKTSVSDGFWSTTSTHELENIRLTTQGSMPSHTASNQSLVHCSGTGSTSSSNDEFVNQGYLKWHQNRLQWLGCEKPKKKRISWKPTPNWDASYECAMETNKPFHCPVPLSELVDLLVDTWEEDGLYDLQC